MKKNKSNYISIILASIVVLISAIWSIKLVGVKDGVTFTMSIILTGIIIYISRKDIKKSIYLFIISLPILVTARKLFYINFLFLKLNFETIIILNLFIINYKLIINKFKNLINEKKINKSILYMISIFVLGGYISCLFSSNFISSLELTTTSVLIPILLFFIFIGVFNKKDYKDIIYSLIISLNLSCLYGFMQIMGIGFSVSAIKASKNMLTFGYHNVNIFVNIALMIYPLLLNELLYKKNTKKETVFLLISLILQSFSIFITFSRGAWLALAIVWMIIFISKKYRVVFIIATLLGSIAVMIMLPTIINRGNEGQKFLENTSNTARVLSIFTSKEIIEDNILGVGLGNFNDNYREYVIDGYYNLSEQNRKKMNVPLYSLEHPHNFFLAIGTELGIISLISILFIFANRIKACISNFNDNRGIFTTICLFIFIGITTGIQLNHKGVITNTYILWILFALITINSFNNEDEKI